jgi:thiol-disulfide isomerase/thioredoxin
MRSRVLSLLLPVVALALALWLMWPQRQPIAPVTFTLTDGTLLHSEALRGTPVLISFWSVSCDVCLRDMPKLSRLAESLADRGLRIVGVAMPYDPPPAVIATVERIQPTFPIALDVHGEIVEAFGGVNATPTVVLLDNDGAVAYRETGRLDEDRIRATFLTL